VKRCEFSISAEEILTLSADSWLTLITPMIVLRLIEYHSLMSCVKGSLRTNFQPLSGAGDDEARHEMSIDHSLVVGTESARILVLGPHLSGLLWVYLILFLHHASKWPTYFQKSHLGIPLKGYSHFDKPFRNCSFFSSGQAKSQIHILQTGQQSRSPEQVTRSINGLAGPDATSRLPRTLSQR